MKKKFMVLGFMFLLVGGFIFFSVGVNASSVYEDLNDYGSYALAEDGSYTIEEMLIYAIEDEYLAKATYEAIIEAYGEVKPFTRIVLAEQTHIDLLLPLFETYGIEVPVNNASEYVVLPDSISSALATGVDAENMNIAMYQAFLDQEDLPDDVRLVFESLLNASEHHLKAFSKDRLFGAGYDLAQKIQNQFRKGNRQQNQSSTGTCTQNA